MWIASPDVKPPPFDYSAPETLDEALTLLREVGDDARPLAGGQSLIPLLSLRLARPSHLIDLAHVHELSGVQADDGTLVLGSMLRERAAERDEQVRNWAPLLALALPLIGHPAIRSRGTIGGSLAHADPAAELPAVALILDADLVARSAARGERTIPASEFFTGFFSTALEPDEVLTGIRIPRLPTHTGCAFEEVARRHGDFAMVGAAAVVRVEDGRISEARVALTGVSDVPVRAPDAEAVLVGSPPTDDALSEAAEQTAKTLSPPSDLHGSSAYRRQLARVLIRRSVRGAAERAEAAA
jgi:carbon-monoxide dehydrogenase medium subunit